MTSTCSNCEAMATATACFRLMVLALVSFDRKSHFASAKSDFFCGTSWEDASTHCEDRAPCPGGADEECATPGHACWELVSPQETWSCSSVVDNAFCGTSWADASANCEHRQPCPRGTHDECSTLGHVCFGETTCSVAAGHGSKFKYMHLKDLASVAYSDLSNNRFCGTDTEHTCSVETHCPGGEECPDGEYCYITTCNIQDVVKEELGDDWVAVLAAYVEGGKGEGERPERLSPDDPQRNNFCGYDHGHASVACDTWCDRDVQCPAGQNCYSTTTCYYDDDLQPSMSPITTPPPTRGPLAFVSRFELSVHVHFFLTLTTCFTVHNNQ